MGVRPLRGRERASLRPPAELLPRCSDQPSDWDRSIGVGDADAFADGTWLLHQFQPAVLVGMSESGGFVTRGNARGNDNPARVAH